MKALRLVQNFILLFSFSLIVSLPAYAQQLAPLSILEKVSILRYLNEMCQDSWCEGAYHIRFKQIFETDSQNGRAHAIILLATDGYGDSDFSAEFNCFVEDSLFLKNAAYSIQSRQYGEATRQLYLIVDSCIKDRLYK